MSSITAEENKPLLSPDGSNDTQSRIRLPKYWDKIFQPSVENARESQLDDMPIHTGNKAIPGSENTNSNGPSGNGSVNSPQGILKELISKCENLTSELNNQSETDENTQQIQDIQQRIQNIQKSLKAVEDVINGFSYAREVWYDFLAAVGRFFAYVLAPFGVFSAVYDGCCKMRDTALTRSIRQPLFDTVKNLIVSTLPNENEQPLDVQTRLKYITLLSSIDRESTRDFLSKPIEDKSEPEGIRLISGLDYILYDKKEDPDQYKIDIEMTPYERFVRNLYIVSHPTCPPDDAQEENQKYTKIKNMEDALNRAYEIENTKLLCHTIHRNLTLGRKIGGLGSGYEALSIDDSPYKLYHQELRLAELAASVRRAFHFSINDKYYEANNLIRPNEKFLTQEDLQKNGLNGFRYADVKSRNIKDGTWNTGFHYINSNNALHIALKRGQPISLLEAKMLGLITPEKAEEFEKKGIFKIKPMYIVFRPVSSARDVLFSAQNILDGTPKLIEEANNFAETVINKINNENKSNPPDSEEFIPFVPVFFGTSQGGLFAQTLAIKNGYPFVVFNSLGPGKGMQKFIGKEKLELATDINHIHCHQFFFIPDDWVSNGIPFVYKAPFAQSYITDELPEEIKRKWFAVRHAYYDSTCLGWLAQSSHSRMNTLRANLLHLPPSLSLCN